MVIVGTKYTFDTLLLASILDNLNLRTWAMSKNGQDDKNRPQSIVNRLLGREEASESEYMLFDTAEAFEEMWKKN